MLTVGARLKPQTGRLRPSFGLVYSVPVVVAVVDENFLTSFYVPCCKQPVRAGIVVYLDFGIGVESMVAQAGNAEHEAPVLSVVVERVAVYQVGVRVGVVAEREHIATVDD